MNLKYREFPIPDANTVASELEMGDHWDSEAVAALIRSKSDAAGTPAFLFLGRKEAAMLTRHLAAAFGDDAVTTLNDTYYMGLDVVVIDCESFVAATGRKIMRTLQDPMSRRPKWRDRVSDTLWQFRI